MSKQVSPFAALTGAEKQIKWLEYQSIRLPYVAVESKGSPEVSLHPSAEDTQTRETHTQTAVRSVQYERPQPPPEVPRVMPEFSKSRHSQYDAVIARLKQAELQARRFETMSQASK